MRLTRRGWVVVAIVALGTTMAAMFGARALNAVVFPCVVALVAAVVQVVRLDPPSVERSLPADGFPDDGGTVTLRFGGETEFTATVIDSLPPGVDGDGTVETTVGREPVSYEVRYRHRGLHTIGPVTFVARDVLGLATRQFSVTATDDVLVYPTVHDLTNGARRDLVSLHDTAESQDRDEFDRLREYVRGDSLRDIHWKSSAKREDLLVKEFSADSRSKTVTVGVGGEEGRADEMAEAAASVVLALLRAGIPVELATPQGTVEIGLGERHHALDHLARVGHGPVPTDDAPVVVEARKRETVVRLNGVETSFDQLVDRDRSRERRSVRQNWRTTPAAEWDDHRRRGVVA